jgi:hypothetical protein
LLKEIDDNIDIVVEFIRITGREIKGQDVFSKLKHRPKLVQIFEELIQYYKNEESLDSVARDFIVQSIEGRKAELAIHAVRDDCEIDMLKCLLKGGQLKKLMGVSGSSTTLN